MSVRGWGDKPCHSVLTLHALRCTQDVRGNTTPILARGTRCACPVASPPAIRRSQTPPFPPSRRNQAGAWLLRFGSGGMFAPGQRLAVASPVRWNVPAPPDTHHDQNGGFPPPLWTPPANPSRIGCRQGFRALNHDEGEPSALPSTPSTPHTPVCGGAAEGACLPLGTQPPPARQESVSAPLDPWP